MPHLDLTRSSIGFDIRHLGVATVHGQFATFAGSLDADGARLAVDVASVDTGDPIRDRRLRAEFFDADHFPAIAFRAAGIGSTIHGELTIRGVTRPVALRATSERLADGSLRLRATGRIKRSEFGLEWAALRQAGRLVVADQVRLAADIVLTGS